MQSTTATTLASEARRLRLAGGRSGGGNIKTSDVVETGNHQPVNLSPAARRRLLRSQHAHSEDESYSGSATRELNGGNATKYGRRSQRRGGGHSTPSRSRESREDTQQLSLPVAESSSVDSDDNGTCFNSVGTASRHPSPKKNRSRRQHLQQNRRSKLDPLQESANSPEEVKRGGGKSIWDHPEKMVST